MSVNYRRLIRTPCGVGCGGRPLDEGFVSCRPKLRCSEVLKRSAVPLLQVPQSAGRLVGREQA